MVRHRASARFQPGPLARWGVPLALGVLTALLVALVLLVLLSVAGWI